MHKPKIIAVINQKGGTGKTTTAINLGQAFNELGLNVLLVDLDQQASLSYSLGIPPPTYSISDWLLGQASFDQVKVAREGMTIVPSTLELADFELKLSQKEDRNYLLKRRLEGLPFDIVLIDCAPSISISTVNCLTAATDVIIPMQLEVLALHGLNTVVNTIKKIKRTLNPDIRILGILISMVNARMKVSAELYSLIKSKVTIRVFASRISVDEKIIEAPSFGQSVLKYAPDTLSSCEFRYLADEIMEVYRKDG